MLARAVIKGLMGISAIGILAVADNIFFNEPIISTVQAQEKDSSKFVLNGDIRAAGRSLNDTPFNQDYSAADSRIRLDFTYTPNDIFSINLRGVAEHSTEPAFDHRLNDKQEYSIDRSSINFKKGNIEVLVGAYANTFTGWMDESIPFFGFQFQYSKKNLSSLDKLTLKLAKHYGQPSWIDESNTRVIAFEIDMEKALSDNTNVSISANYMHWGDPDTDKDFIRTNKKEGIGYASDFHIANLGGKLVVSTGDKGPLTINTNAMYNFGAEDDNYGIMLGLSFGNLKEQGNFCLALLGRYIEADATIAAYVPKVTPNTNFSQLVIAGGYNIKSDLFGEGNDLVLKVSQGFPKRIDGPDKGWLYTEISLNYNFTSSF